MRYSRPIITVVAALGSLASRGEELPLSLDECLRAALEANPEIAVSRKDRRAAELLHDAAHGIFDPVLSAGLNASRSEQAATSQLTGADVLVQERQWFDSGVSQLLPWGGTVKLDLASSRFETNSAFSSLNPGYDGSLTLSARQPLLRSFGRDQTRYQIRSTKLTEKGSERRLSLQLVQTLQNVENAYWDIVLARSDLEVKRQSLKVAEDLLAQNRIRVEVGTLAPIELVQAEAGVAIREQAIIAAEGTLGDAEDRLRREMGVPPDSDMWGKAIRPTDEPKAPETMVSLEEAMASARGKRAEIALAQLDLDAKRLATAYQRSLLRPTLDATASYGGSGIGGDEIVRDENLAVVGTIPGGLGDALDQVVRLDFPAWTLGLTFGYPIKNRAGRATYASARIEEEKAGIELSKTQQDIDLDVRTALRGLVTARKSVEAAAASERAQAKKLEAEQKKFENGLSTSFQVLEFDEDLAAARSELRRAETGVRKALVNLERAMGTLLEEKGVAIEPTPR